jgi:lipid-binding SYLF domain-containing protein
MTRRYSVVFGISLLAVLLVGVALPTLSAGKISEAAERRAQIDAFAQDTMQKLFAESEKAKRLYDRAVAYAVFDSAKFALFVSGGGGVGVAVDKSSGDRTYMKMGTGGVGFGIGGQVYQLIFLFEDEQTFRSFVDQGWEAGASANAVAGKAGVNAQGSFVNGLAVYQLTEAGLMLQADLAGTKYWKYRKLNEY